MQDFVETVEGQLTEMGHKIPRSGAASRLVAAEALLVENVGGASIQARRLELVA